MTKRQMLAEIKKRGGLTPRSALEITIKKWKGLTVKMCFDEQGISNNHFPFDQNCALCKLYLHLSDGCEGCPLEKPNGCQRGSLYYKSLTHLREDNEEGFDKARNRLVRKMEKALEKLPLKQEEKEQKQ